MDQLQARYQHIKSLVSAEGSVKLLVVTKGRSVAQIKTLVEQGQQDFGESYWQEAKEKMSLLADPLSNKKLTWHFVGRVQSNKAKEIAMHFDWVHSVCDLKIAQRLAEVRQDDPLNVCLQVNISGEASKAGVAAESIPALAEELAALRGIRLRGLMAIPTQLTRKNQRSNQNNEEDFVRMARYFASLKQRYTEMDTLSMGMSADYQEAIAAGATLVRIGRAIFEANN